MSFHPFTSAEYHHGAVQDSQASFDFGGEVDVARCVEQVDGAIFPAERHASSENRDATLLLFGIVIGFGRTRIHGSRAVLGTAHVKHLFRDGRLASINVSDDANVS